MDNDGAPVKRVGVLGGTFDPIRRGHLTLAERAMSSLDLVLFVPSAHAAHSGKLAASAADRFAMVHLAIEGDSRFIVSDLEQRREETCFTVDLLRALSAQLGPEVELFFLAGSDVLTSLHRWKEPEMLLQLARLAILPRPGYDLNLEVLEMSLPAAVVRVIVLPGPGLHLSSTLVRDRLAQDLPVDGLLPEAVAAYVRERSLYHRVGSPARPLQRG